MPPLTAPAPTAEPSAAAGPPTVPSVGTGSAAVVRHRTARRRDQRGEGVISAAIAVLIMAFIGVGMWLAFNTMFQTTAKNINHQVNSCIGQTSASC